MQKVPSTQEVAELELALENARKVPAFRTLLLMFWGLILAKCLLAQWMILSYHAPINGFVFVILPSVLISGFITLYYARHLFRELPHMPLNGRLVNATWLACGIGFAVLSVAAFAYHEFTAFLLPSIAAVLLGIGCYIHSVLDRRRIFKFMAFGWWLSALWLFNVPDQNALAWMSLAMVLFQVLPSAWLYFSERRRKSA